MTVKRKANNFNVPQIGRLIKNFDFVNHIIKNELNVWNSFKGEINNFPLNHKVLSCKNLVKKMLFAVGKLGSNMTIKNLFFQPSRKFLWQFWRLQ